MQLIRSTYFAKQKFKFYTPIKHFFFLTVHSCPAVGVLYTVQFVNKGRIIYLMFPGVLNAISRSEEVWKRIIRSP